MAKESDRYKWMVLAIACIGSLMAPLDTSIVGVTLPVMAESLRMDYAQVIWVPTAYLVTIASLLLSFGRMSDLGGRKRLYLIGFSVFVLASVFCSFSQDGVQLIASRVLQGVGGALMMAISPAIITSAFPPEERGKALGINAMFVYIGLSLGPPLGGFLTDLYGWPSIFLINVPIGIVVVLMGYCVLREDQEAREGRFDLSGAVLFSAALISLLLALTFGSDWGWASPEILSLLTMSAIAAAVFVVVERRKGKEAMLSLALFTKNRLFGAGNVSALLNYTSYFAVTFIISFYLQKVLDLSITTTGLVLLVMPLIMAITAPLSGAASDRIGSRTLATGGMIIIAFSLWLLSTLTSSNRQEDVMLYLLLLGLGMGMFSSPNTSSIMGSVKKDQLGVASGTLSTMRVVGQSLSLAIMGAIIAAVAGSGVADQIFGGLATSDVIAAEGFLVGMHLAFLVGAGIALVGAVASSIRGRHN